MDTPQIAIIGAGPTGLTLALELGRRGVSCVLYEPNEAVSIVPRSTLVNVRSMEHLRRLGVADAVCAAGLPADHAQDIVFATRLFGP
ncbi:MAG: FAD-dependent monooxygenase, partial [Myxococcales bacterium]|nr:FAD-dependent monooxygenase [Myxococcales bacterium]